MKPLNLTTKIFLDGGDPQETREAISLLGFLDGQTTNPTLISKNPQAQERLLRGEKFSEEEIYDFYRQVVSEISSLIPQGSISIEVYADLETSAEEMFNQGKKMNQWINNAWIKYPTTHKGLEAAQKSVSEGLRVNLTLTFTQEQAAAVYGATKGVVGEGAFVSPFVGRIEDQGLNGMSLIDNIMTMYRNGDHHVKVLVASVRSLEHFLYSIKLGADIITSPMKILREWVEGGMIIPDDNFFYSPNNLKDIPYLDLDITRNWEEFNVNSDLTVKGIEKFAQDWNSLIK